MDKQKSSSRWLLTREREEEEPVRSYVEGGRWRESEEEKEEEDRNFVVATQIETQHVVTSRNRTQVPAAGDGQGGLAALKAKIQKLEADLSKKNEYITFLNKKHRDLVQRLVIIILVWANWKWIAF